MRCPKCKNHVLQKSETRIRLRTKGAIIFEDGVCKSQCYWCREPIEIPVELIPSKERFVITRD